jgi:N-acetylneuraminic acid mutarotase
MFMFGGYGGSGRLDDFYEFNFETKVWSKVRYNGPSPGVRENNGVVEYKGCLYLFGGK